MTVISIDDETIGRRDRLAPALHDFVLACRPAPHRGRDRRVEERYRIVFEVEQTRVYVFPLLQMIKDPASGFLREMSLTNAADVNADLISGNAPDARIEKLRSFWEGITP